MSQENVEILRRSLEAFDRRNRTAWIAVRDHDLELVTSGEWPEGDVRGPEAAWDFYIKVADAFERQPYSDEVELVDARPTRSWPTIEATSAAVKAAQTLRSTTGSSSPFAEERSFATSGSRTMRRPSKPPGGRNSSRIIALEKEQV